jgi:hypothetical protein
MRRAVIKHLVGRKPFKAFRITVSTKESFDVRHPEAVYLAKRFLALARAPTESTNLDASPMVWIDYRHIVHCQPIFSRDIPF